MASMDDIFYREFKQMMGELKARNGYADLQSIPLPDSLKSVMFVERRDMVAISPDIDDEYYGRLADSVALLWGRGRLAKRKYDHKGEYMRDTRGSFIWEDVSVPRDCAAVLSDRRIGVPNSYCPSEDGFSYIEMLKSGDRVKYIYTVPRKYLYKVNQTALVLSWNRLRVYYSSVSLAMTNGSVVYVSIIPYRPTSNAAHNYRLLMSKPSVDYGMELEAIRDYWVSSGVIFNPAYCTMYDCSHGRDNAAMQVLDGVMDTYEMFDLNKPLGEEEDDVEDLVIQDA